MRAITVCRDISGSGPARRPASRAQGAVFFPVSLAATVSSLARASCSCFRSSVALPGLGQASLDLAHLALELAPLGAPHQVTDPHAHPEGGHHQDHYRHHRLRVVSSAPRHFLPWPTRASSVWRASRSLASCSV